MKPLSNILGKEIRELLTPATVIPVIILAILFGSLGGIMGDVGEEVAKPPIMGIINEDDGGLSTVAVEALQFDAEIVYNGTNVDEGLEAVASAGGIALLVIPDDFTQNITSNTTGTIEVYWIMSGTGILDTLSSASLDARLGAVNNALSMVIIESGMDIDANTTINPIIKSETTSFKGKTLDGVSPSAISATLSSQSIIVPLSSSWSSSCRAPRS